MAVEFIVVEGIDGAGKSLQTGLLREKLESRGYDILVGDFPRYETSEWGRLVGKLLKGEFGGLNEVHPYLAALPYMLDEYTWSRDVARPWKVKGGMILSNRYFTSNVHQVAKLRGMERDVFRDWIWRAGYEELGILKPDLVLFLDVDPEISLRLGQKKGARNYVGGRGGDIAEVDSEHQKAAYNEYLRMVGSEPEWRRVGCVMDGDILPIEVIHNRVWSMVEGMLGLSRDLLDRIRWEGEGGPTDF